ncbi:MAG TPA: response regulator [Deinococcales bacterium]|nr:response regulator [Deinococcales bacterium]
MTSEEKVPTPTVLVAEDNEDHAMFIRRALRDSGLAIVHRTDGEEAIRYLRDESNEMPVLALLDVNMPRLSGFDVLKMIREDERLRWMPVVMFSTSATRSDVRAAYEYGANSYVPKPMDFREFQDRLKEIGEYWTRVNRGAE